MSLIFIAGISVTLIWAGERYLFFKKITYQDRRLYRLQHTQRALWKTLRDKYPAVTRAELVSCCERSAALDREIMQQRHLQAQLFKFSS